MNTGKGSSGQDSGQATIDSQTLLPIINDECDFPLHHMNGPLLPITSPLPRTEVSVDTDIESALSSSKAAPHSDCPPWNLKRNSEGVLQVFTRGLTESNSKLIRGSPQPLDSKTAILPITLSSQLPPPLPPTSSSHRKTRCSREIRKRRRRELEERFGADYTTIRNSKRRNPNQDRANHQLDHEYARCHWTFVFDPAGRFLHWWSFVVSLAFLYNFWTIIYRYSFDEIRSDTIQIWFPLDYTADLVYIADIAVCFRTGYLEDGVLQTDVQRMRVHYMNSTKFYIDCLCMLPLDFLYLSIGFRSMVRVFRLVKIYKFWQFSDRVERHTNYPNVIRSIKLLHYLLAIVHWNACLFKLVADAVRQGSPSAGNMDTHLNAMTSDDRGCGRGESAMDGGAKRDWKVPHFNSTSETYLYALYWSCLTLTLMGDLPKPESVGAYVFVIFEVLFGLLLFATVLGHSSNIVTNVSAARKDFQSRLDNVKNYLNHRRVPANLQEKVIKWFDYLWSSNKIADENKVLSTLPDKLKAEIAIHVHLDTLKRVEIFQNTEEGFLSELVLRLRPVLVSPGDYICRKGEVGKEMYVVNRGRLHVVGDDDRTVLATLRPGSYFGEISILNMGTAGNRRTASVKSVGYSDLFCLAKTDLWDVLKEYPAARVKLEAVAVKRLENYKKRPSQEAMSRSRSTPGLVESLGSEMLPESSMAALAKHYLNHMADQSKYPQVDDDADTPDYSSPNTHLGAPPFHPLHQSSIELSHFPHLQIPPSRCSPASVTPQPNSPLPSQSRRPSGSRKSSLRGTESCRSSVRRQSASPRRHSGSAVILPPPSFCGRATGITNLPGPPITSSASSSTDISNHQPASPPKQATPRPKRHSLSLPPAHSFSPRLQASPTHSAHGGCPPTFGMHRLGEIPVISIDRASPASSPAGSTARLPTSTPIPGQHDPSSDILLHEISRLRQKVVSLETENTSLQVKLNQQHWNIENRLQELEMIGRRRVEEDQSVQLQSCDVTCETDNEGDDLIESDDESVEHPETCIPKGQSGSSYQ